MTSQHAVTSPPVQRHRAWSTASADRQLVRAFQDAWNRGEPPDAAAALARHPRLANDRDAVVDLAYEEYCLRLEAGELIDKAAFSARFAPFARDVRDTLDAHSLAVDYQDLICLAPTLGELQPGDHLLGFTLLRELGEGSFSRVFLAAERALADRLVVIKVSVRGAAEAETLGRLTHPNIVPVHSFHEDPSSGLTLVCMPYLGNATLADLLDQRLPGPKTPGQARLILDTIDAVALGEEPGAAPALQAATPDRILRDGLYVEGVLHLGAQLADALAFIHGQGICHRDLKPANVLLGRDGMPRLLDFNLSFDELLAGRRLGGTPPYTAPEQLRALAAGAEDPEAPLDARADIYSLGVLLFELLTGEHPFGPIPENLRAEELFQMLLQRQRRGPAPLLRANRFLGTWAAELIERCLAFERSDRPASAAEVCAELRRSLSAVQRARRWVRCHARALLPAAVLLLATGVVSAALVATHEPPALVALQIGQQAYTKGQLAEADQQLTRAVEGDPTLTDAWFLRGRARQQLGQFDLAIKDYEKAAAFQEDGRALACMAYCLNRQNSFRSAIEGYKKALKEGFRTAEVYNNLGYSSWKAPPENPGQPRFAQALQCLAQAVHLNPNLQAAHHNLALIDLSKAIDHSTDRSGYIPLEGIADIEVAIKLGPVTADLHRDAAVLYGVAARRDPQYAEKALEHIRSALEHGVHPAKIAEDVCFSCLKNREEFVTLVARPPAPPASTRSELVVDPIQD
jgi:tetratricopeptide (TPR) repeat protein